MVGRSSKSSLILLNCSIFDRMISCRLLESRVTGIFLINFSISTSFLIYYSCFFAPIFIISFSELICYLFYLYFSYAKFKMAFIYFSICSFYNLYFLLYSANFIKFSKNFFLSLSRHFYWAKDKRPLNKFCLSYQAILFFSLMSLAYSKREWKLLCSQSYFFIYNPYDNKPLNIFCICSSSFYRDFYAAKPKISFKLSQFCFYCSLFLRSYSLLLYSSSILFLSLYVSKSKYGSFLIAGAGVTIILGGGTYFLFSCMGLKQIFLDSDWWGPEQSSQHQQRAPFYFFPLEEQWLNRAVWSDGRMGEGLPMRNYSAQSTQVVGARTN